MYFEDVTVSTLMVYLALCKKCAYDFDLLLPDRTSYESSDPVYEDATESSSINL